jgi:hypothetical protein
MTRSPPAKFATTRTWCFTIVGPASHVHSNGEALTVQS